MPDRAGRGRRPTGARASTPVRRGRYLRPIVGLLVVPMLLLPASVSAQDRSSSEIEREVEEIEQREQQLSQELDGVRDELVAAEIELADIGARLDDARQRLVAAEGQVQLAELALEEAERERDLANDAYEAALEKLEQTRRELEAEEQIFVDQVVHTFKYGTVGATRGAMVLEVLRRAEDPNAFAVGLKQLQVVVDDQDATVQNVFELRDRHAEHADDAALARREAAELEADAVDSLHHVELMREEAEQVARQVEHEEAEQQRVMDSLRATEAETEALLVRVAERKKESQRELQAQRAREEEERRRRAEEEARRAAAAARSSSSGGGGGGGPVVDGMVCPVVGAVAGRDFSNDWGYPRSGGRSHQGNDIFASRGTSVVAVAAGTVVRMNPPSSPTSLGGITVTYRTGDGSEWYNAHLHTIADGIAPGASVSRGQVIGTVGNTGNARTTPPHLHLGRRYGGSWVNPWPTTSGVCR